MGWFSRLMDSFTRKKDAPLEGWPPGAYRFGPWGEVYVPRGTTSAGPFKRIEEYHDWVRRIESLEASNAANDKALGSANYSGRFPAANFMLGPREGREAAFIYAASRVFNARKGDDLYRNVGLFSGTYADISRLINYGEQEQIFEHRTYEQTIADFPDTPLKKAVMEKLS